MAAVVVGTNDGPWLEACLASLSDSRGVSDLRIVYVDNASSDGSVALVRERFPHVTVVEVGGNYGFAHANNAGMEEARRLGAAYAFLVNPDTRSPRGLIATLASFMDRHRGYGIVGPLQTEYAPDRDVDLPSPPNAWSRLALRNGERNVFHHDAPSHPSEAGPSEGRAEDTLEHAYVQGSALFVRLEALDWAGMLDPLYHTYYEEVDLCRRVRWCGFRVALLLTATIQHRGGDSGPISDYRSFHMLRNRYVYLLTDPTWSGREIARLSLVWLGQMVRRTVRPRPSDPFSPTPLLLARVAGSLVAHVPHILARRRRNARLAQSGLTG